MIRRELYEGIANGELEASDVRPYLTDRSDAKKFAFRLFCSTESGEVYFVESSQDVESSHDEWMEDIQTRGLTIEQENRNNRIFKAITELEEYYGFRVFEDEPTNSNCEKSRELPDELNNDIARGYFAKAIELDLMDEKFNWKVSRSDLAYFVANMSGKLDLLDRLTYNNILGKDDPAVHWEPFEELFGIKKGTLRGYYSKYKNGKVDPPKAKNKIDSIFK